MLPNSFLSSLLSLLSFSIFTINTYATECVPLCSLNEPLQTAILSTGCGVPVTDKPKVLNALKDIEKNMADALVEIKGKKNPVFSYKEIKKLSDYMQKISSHVSTKYEVHRVHESLELLRLQLAGMRLSKGYICSNDFLWIFHEAFHPAMHMGRHSQPATKYSDEQWATGSDSINRASNILSLLETMSKGLEEKENQKRTFLIQRARKALNNMENAVQEKNTSNLKESANMLRKSFRELLKNIK